MSQELIQVMQEAERRGDMDTAKKALKKLEELQQSIAPESPANNPGISDRIMGAVEPVMSLGSGMVADVVGNIGGGIQALLNPNNPMAGPDSRDRIKNTLTYQPRSETGQMVMQGYGEILQPVNDAIEKARLGDEVLEAGGPEWLAKNAEGIPEYASAILAPLAVRGTSATQSQIPKAGTPGYTGKKHQIGVDLRNNPTKANTAEFDLNMGKVVKHPLAKRALDQGWSKQGVAWIKSANDSTKAKIRKMVILAKKRSQETGTGKSSMTTRPSDVVGDSLHQRYQFIKKANESSGKLLGKIARDAKGVKVDLSNASNWFNKQLNDLGISVQRGDDGVLKVDFSQSKLAKADHGLIRENLRHIDRELSKDVDFFKAHELKQILRRTGLSYKETVAKKGASPEVQNLFKGFSGKIDEVLDGMSPAYDKQNIKYAETIEVVDAMKDLVKNRLFQDSADKSMGTLMRRLTGNAESRAPLMDMLENIDQTARKYGARFNDDLYLQQFIANEMDDVLNVAAPTSIKGEIGAAALERPSLGSAARFIDNAMKFAGQKSEAKALEALMQLSR